MASIFISPPKRPPNKSQLLREEEAKADGMSNKGNQNGTNANGENISSAQAANIIEQASGDQINPNLGNQFSGSNENPLSTQLVSDYQGTNGQINPNSTIQTGLTGEYQFNPQQFLNRPTSCSALGSFHGFPMNSGLGKDKARTYSPFFITSTMNRKVTSLEENYNALSLKCCRILDLLSSRGNLRSEGGGVRRNDQIFSSEEELKTINPPNVEKPPVSPRAFVNFCPSTSSFSNSGGKTVFSRDHQVEYDLRHVRFNGDSNLTIDNQQSSAAKTRVETITSSTGATGQVNPSYHQPLIELMVGNPLSNRSIVNKTIYVTGDQYRQMIESSHCDYSQTNTINPDNINRICFIIMRMKRIAI